MSERAYRLARGPWQHNRIEFGVSKPRLLSSTVILDYASSLLANALNRHYYFVLLGAAKNIDG